jgi:hypothetical protein
MNYFLFDAQDAVMGLFAFAISGFFFGGILGLFRYLIFFSLKGGEKV